jgi:hypothetical protein
VRAILETTNEGFARMLSDPWLFIWHTHLLLTFVHFITWQVGGAGRRGQGRAPAAFMKPIGAPAPAVHSPRQHLPPLHRTRGGPGPGRWVIAHSVRLPPAKHTSCTATAGLRLCPIPLLPQHPRLGSLTCALQTTYGGVGGAGPASRAVREFDDVVVSLMGLSGWLAVIYFFR